MPKMNGYVKTFKTKEGNKDKSINLSVQMIRSY